MDEIADLLRELILEVRELKAEVSVLTSPTPNPAGYNLADLIENMDRLCLAVTGPLGYHLGDVVDAVRDDPT